MTDDRRLRLPGAFRLVAAAWHRTSVVGQQAYDDVLFTHPDIAHIRRACAAWGRLGGR